MAAEPYRERLARPVSRGWFGVGVAAIIVTLILTAIGASRVYGQQERQVETNTRDIDRLQERDERYETAVDSKLTGINETLREQHGVLSRMEGIMQGMQKQMERANGSGMGGRQ